MMLRVMLSLCLLISNMSNSNYTLDIINNAVLNFIVFGSQ